jgi:hypothetical protein
VRCPAPSWPTHAGGVETSLGFITRGVFSLSLAFINRFFYNIYDDDDVLLLGTPTHVTYAEAERTSLDALVWEYQQRQRRGEQRRGRWLR